MAFIEFNKKVKANKEWREEMFKILGLLLVIGLTSCTNSNSPIDQNSKENEVISLEAKSMTITGVLDFGTMLPTATSKLVTFTLKNNGTESLLGPATLSGSDFSIAYQNCGTVAPTKSCTVKVSFNPAGKSGPYTSTLTLDSVSGALTASVTPPEPPAASVQFLVSSVDVSSSGLDFGTITDKQSIIKNISIKNNGLSLISAESIVLGSNYVLSYDSCSNKSLAVGSSCSVKVSLNGAGKSGAISDSLQFAGKTLALSGQVTATSSSSGSGNVSLQYLNGTSVITDYNYGTLAGSQSIALILNIKNNGTISFSGGVVNLSSTDFSIIYNACNNKSLAVGASCQVRVSFSAAGKANNTYSGILSLGDVNLPLSATVLTPQPVISYSPVYSSYGSCSAKPCDVSGQQFRTITSCRKLSDGVDVGLAPLSSCSSFQTDANLKQSCPSPAGNKTINISYGTKVVSCLASSSEQTLVSLTCSPGYSESNGLCVQGAVITYSPTYSEYGNCSAQVCDGSGQQNRTITSCQKLSNGTPVSGGQLSDCASFNLPANLQQACQSPAGNKTISIDNGSKEVSCDAGSNVQNLVSITCSNDFHEQSGACVADVITFEPSYSAFGACSAQACDGTGTESRTLESCQKISNGTPVAGGQISDCSAYNTAGYLDQPCFSPAGDIVSQISNGSSTMTCSEGQTNGPTMVNCDSGYHENAGACDQNSYIATYPVNNLQACEGTQSVQPISCRESWGSQIDVSLSLCPNEDQQSPAGVQSTPITGGTSNLTCQAGQSTGTTDISCSSGYSLSNNSCVQVASFDPGFKMLFDYYQPGSGTTTNECGAYFDFGTGPTTLILRAEMYDGFDNAQPITNPGDCSSSMYSNIMFFMQMNWVQDPVDSSSYICVHYMYGSGVKLTEEQFMNIGMDCSSLFWSKMSNFEVQEITIGTPAVEALNPASVVGVGDYLYFLKRNMGNGASTGLYRTLVSSDSNPYSIETVDSSIQIYSDLWDVNGKLLFKAESGSGSKHFVYDPASGNAPSPINVTCPTEPCLARGEKKLSNGDLVISLVSTLSGNRYIYKTSDLVNFTLIGDVAASGLTLHEPFDSGWHSEELNGYLYYLNNNSNKIVKMNLSGGQLTELNITMGTFKMVKVGSAIYIFSSSQSIYKIDSNQNVTMLNTPNSDKNFIRLMKASNFLYLTAQGTSTYDMYKLDTVNDSITLLAANYASGCSSVGDYDLVNPLSDNLMFDCYYAPTSTMATKILNKNTGAISLLGSFHLGVTNSFPFSFGEYYTQDNQKHAIVYKDKLYMKAYGSDGVYKLFTIDAQDQIVNTQKEMSSELMTIFKDNLFMGLNLQNGEAPNYNYELYKFYQP